MAYKHVSLFFLQQSKGQIKNEEDYYRKKRIMAKNKILSFWRDFFWDKAFCMVSSKNAKKKYVGG